MLDAIRAYEEGVGSIEQIDAAMKGGADHPMGPFTLLDFVGLDTTHSIAEIMFDEYRERRFAPPPTLRKMVTAGCLGRKSGRGFYDYSGDKPVPMDHEHPTIDASAEEPGPSGASKRRSSAPSPAAPSATARGSPIRASCRARAGRAARRRGSFAEEALLANWDEEGLGADGVVTAWRWSAAVASP